MAEVEKLSLIQILAIKIKKMVGAQIIKRWHCQLGQYQVFSRQKNMWTGFISWMKIRLLTLIRSPSAHAPTWIIRYFSFQPHYQLWRLFNTNWTKIYLCLVATFVNWIPWKSYDHTAFLSSVLVLSLFGKCICIFVALIFQTTNNPYSFNKVRKGRNYDIFAKYRHSCYVRKIYHSVPRCSGRTDSTDALALRKRLASM